MSAHMLHLLYICWAEITAVFCCQMCSHASDSAHCLNLRNLERFRQHFSHSPTDRTCQAVQGAHDRQGQLPPAVGLPVDELALGDQRLVVIKPVCHRLVLLRVQLQLDGVVGIQILHRTGAEGARQEKQEAL